MKESMGKILTGLGIEERNLGGFCGEWMGSGPELSVTTPIDGSKVATVGQVTEEEYDAIVSRAHEAFLHWRTVPGSPPWGVGPSDRGPTEEGQGRVGRARHARDGVGGGSPAPMPGRLTMRRQTNTVNWSTEPPLAQGIEFGGSGGPPPGDG